MAIPSLAGGGRPWLGRMLLVATACVTSCAGELPVEDSTDVEVTALDLIGLRVDSLALVSLGDSSPDPLRFPGSGPVGLLLFDSDDCLSCISLGRELLTLDRWSRRAGGTAMGVVQSGDLETVRRYIQRNSIRVKVTLADGALLGDAPHPAVVILSPDGTIITVLDRGDWRSEDRPLAKFLTAIEWER